MAKMNLTLSVRLPWWWKIAMRGFLVYHVVRSWLGREVDEKVEGGRIGEFIMRHTRFEAR